MTSIEEKTARGDAGGGSEPHAETMDAPAASEAKTGATGDKASRRRKPTRVTEAGEPVAAGVIEPEAAAVAGSSATAETEGAPRGRVAAAAADIADRSHTARRPTKLDRLIALLSRPDGASLAEMVEATGWQAHSVRGAIAGALRKRGHVIASSKAEDGVRRYRIGGAA